MAQAESIVRTQIIPLAGMSLILPNTCIAEVIGYSEPVPVDGSPDWLVGMVGWRGVTIPIISFEAVNELPVAKKTKLTRVAVLNGISGNDKLSFYGVVVQGIPRLASLEETSIEAISKPEMKLPLAMEQTVVDGQNLVIPDQVKIEKLLKKAGVVVDDVS